MRNPMNVVFAAIAAATGVITMLSGLPLIRRRVPPNRWYGFRTPRTLRDERVWYEVNEYVGRLLIWYGTAIMATAVAFALSPPLPEDVLVGSFLAVVTAGLLVLLVLSFRRLNHVCGQVQQTGGDRDGTPTSPEES